jgi:ribosomal protein S8
MVEPDHQRPLCVLLGAWRWSWTSILTCERHLCWCWRPSLSSYRPGSPFSDYSDTETIQAAKDVIASQDALIDIFERIENFFRRLEEYAEVPTTEAMKDIIVKIMVEVLGLFAIVTKEMKQGRAKKYLKKLIGRRDIEDALNRLDRLTQEEARMAIAQVLKVAHRVEHGVETVGDQVKDVGGQVMGQVTGVGDQVRGVDNKVTDVDEKVNVAIEGKFSTLAHMLS